MPTLTQSRSVIIVAGIAVCLAYLAGGARGIGAGDRDYVFSPAVNPEVQLAVPAADVALGAPPTLSALAARGSLSVALGRRSAVRDFAAISASLAAAAFAAALHAAGIPTLVVLVAMLGMSLGDTFWWRGITYTSDALFPAVALLAIWAAMQWRARRRRSMAVLAAISAAIAIAESAVALAVRGWGPPATEGFVTSLTREFTPLGVCLAVIGLVVLVQSSATRIVAAITAAGLLAWHWVGRSAIDPIGLPLVLAGWWAIAAALAWLLRLTSQRAGHVLIAVIAIVLVGTPPLTRWRLWALGKDIPSDQRTRVANEFSADDAPEGARLIAESRRADTAMLLSSRLKGRPVTIVPQSPDRVAAALRDGRPILAFDHARANLEQLGFLFERAIVGNVSMSRVSGHVPCVPLNADTFSDVSLLLANGSFVIHGASYAAPAGVVIRMAAAAPVEVATIEPRSVPFELGTVAADAEGVPELLQMSRSLTAAITSIRIPTTGRLSPVTATFNTAPLYAVATAEEATPVSICAGASRSGIALGAASAATASIRMDDNAPFVAGWHPVEADPDFFRWTAAPDASLRITAAQPTPVRVTITATPASRPAQRPTIALTVNGCRLDLRSMQAGQGDYEWDVEQRCWLPGVNQLWIHTSPLISPASLFATHDTRLLGARIGAIRFVRR